jgi:hypothetical protein
MIFLHRSPGSAPRCARAFGAAGTSTVLLLVALLTGCASSFRPAHRLVPGPSGALAAAPLSRDRIAVLAGNENSKGIFLIDLKTGEVLKSFGVTREAMGVTAESGEGPLLLAVGGINPQGKAYGAVERWTLAGGKMQVVPLPAEGIGMTRIIDGAWFVMLQRGEARSAIPIASPSLRLGKPTALDAGAKSLEQCKIGSNDYLVFSGGTQGTIVVRELETGIVVRSTVVADNPTCLAGRDDVFAIQKSFASRTITVLTLPGLLQASLVPASNDAAGLYESIDHHLLALNATSRLSNIETFPDDAFDMKSSGPNATATK